jgi:hypothetical protein
MKHVARVSLAVVIAAGLAGRIVAAQDSKAVKTMAGILLKLNHFPSDAEKKTLKDIADDKATTAPERIVAQAITNVQHTAAAEDKMKLEAVGKDGAAPDSVKALAAILLRLNHTPNAQDKERLTKIAGS